MNLFLFFNVKSSRQRQPFGSRNRITSISQSSFSPSTRPVFLYQPANPVFPHHGIAAIQLQNSRKSELFGIFRNWQSFAISTEDQFLLLSLRSLCEVAPCYSFCFKMSLLKSAAAQMRGNTVQRIRSLSMMRKMRRPIIRTMVPQGAMMIVVVYGPSRGDKTIPNDHTFYRHRLTN